MAWEIIDKDVIKRKKEHLAQLKYKKIICSRASSFQDIVGNDLIEGIQYRIVTEMSFNANTVLEYLTDHHEIIELYIAVYRMNNKAFDYLKSLITEKKVKTSFIISTFFRENKKYERWAHELKEMANNNKHVRASFHNSHAKVFLAKTKCNKHIVFEGSGNLSHNERIEQYIIENNKQTYNFHKEWMDEIINV